METVKEVNAITVDDLKAFYAKAMSPKMARVHVVGSLGSAKIVGSLNSLNKRWKGGAVKIPVYRTPAAPSRSQLYFYDIPDAKQSVLRIGYPALAATDADYYPAVVTNYILGGGGFASQLTQELRETKGYTYGITSQFTGSTSPGPFVIGSGVRSNVTFESLALIKKIVEEFGKNYSDKDLETTQSFLIKSNARAFETAGAKLNMLENISKYGWKYDYVKGREQIVKGMTVNKIKELSAKYLNAERMFWFVAGDAKTQLPRLKELGFGEPTIIQK